ncbi:hypothetical protein PENSPDRAFT_646745 [Peniophora sp. CONT]|nr:hypothetical protein PENSPDRAFT_646745 [Peniophora sp. CONT]
MPRSRIQRSWLRSTSNLRHRLLSRISAHHRSPSHHFYVHHSRSQTHCEHSHRPAVAAGAQNGKAGGVKDRWKL